MTIGSTRMTCFSQPSAPQNTAERKRCSPKWMRAHDNNERTAVSRSCVLKGLANRAVCGSD